jgi:hypothetical protein
MKDRSIITGANKNKRAFPVVFVEFFLQFGICSEALAVHNGRWARQLERYTVCSLGYSHGDDSDGRAVL